MKSFLKSLIAALLILAARLVVRRYNPRIVMITGSVGKTSTKDAVAAALASHFFVRKSEKSYNSEFGVPFTIFGVQNPWGNVFAWIGVGKAVFGLLVLPNHYPNVLVLEVGADRPGDLARMLRIAVPDAVVVTRLPEIPVHVEAYASPEAVREEEFSPAYALAPSAPLVVASDDVYARALSKRTSAEVHLFGSGSDAQVRLLEVGWAEEEGRVVGMTVRLSLDGTEHTLCIRGSVGRTQVLPALAAVAVAGALGVSTKESLDGLASYEPPPGRGRLFEGVNGSTVIDDTYNSSPAAVEEALATLSQFPRAVRRIAVLGDMLELGRYSVAEHERIGVLASKTADVLVTVGVRARACASAASAAGMKEDAVLTFDDSVAAGEALTHFVQAGDVVLVKGSQSIRTERTVEVLLRDASDRVRLVRQEREWLRR